jgi:hypothetical protein
VYNEYELLRQFVESILYNVSPDSYEKVIIIDDYSRKDTKLRQYEKWINENLEKFEVVMFDKYRHMRFYNTLEQTENFNKKAFDDEVPNMGIMKSYQMALEMVQTPYVLCCDTDNVFLHNFKDSLDKVSKFYDENPDVMCISQLQGHSSDENFKSNKVGLKNMPNENGGAGGPSPMFSTFRIDGWKVNKICPLCSSPGQRRGNGFQDYFLSLIGSGYFLLNFPFFSKDIVFHIGGGTARRNITNVGKKRFVRFGHVKDTNFKYGPRSGEAVCDYYAGAHYLTIGNDEFERYLEDKYNIPFNQKAPPFDETLLRKYKLKPCEWHPPHEVVVARQKEILDPECSAKKVWWDRYTYGEKSDIDWSV